MEKRQINKEERKVLNSMFWRSHLVFNTFNMAKMQANGFTCTMAPAIETVYGDDMEGKREAYIRHNNFFNTHAVPFSFIAGLCYAMEREHKENGSIDGQTIENGDQVVDIISTHSAGDEMTMIIDRNGQEMEVQVTMYGTLPEGTESVPAEAAV